MLVQAARDLEGDGRAQESDRRADTGAARHDDPVDAQLVGDARGVQRGAAAERDQGSPLEVPAVLHGVFARRIRHVLVDHFRHAEGRRRGVEIERRADICGECAFRRRRVQHYGAAGESGRVDPAEHDVGIGHGRAGSAAA